MSLIHRGLTTPTNQIHMATAQLAQIAGRYVQLSQKEIKSRIIIK